MTKNGFYEKWDVTFVKNINNTVVREKLTETNVPVWTSENKGTEEVKKGLLNVSI